MKNLWRSWETLKISSVENSWFIKKKKDIRREWEISWETAYKESKYKKFLKSMLRQLIYVRRNSLNSFFVSRVLKIFFWFYGEIYLKVYHPETLKRSWFVSASKELEHNIESKTTPYTGKLVLLTVVANTVAYSLTGREIDWVGWYFRAIWTIIALVLMNCPFRFGDLTSESKLYPFFKDKYDQLVQFLNMD